MMPDKELEAARKIGINKALDQPCFVSKALKVSSLFKDTEASSDAKTIGKLRKARTNYPTDNFAFVGEFLYGIDDINKVLHKTIYKAIIRGSRTKKYCALIMRRL